MTLRGKIAIITRGSSELGKLLAIRLKEEGAIVILADMNEKKLSETASEVGAMAITADITSQSDIKRLINKTTERFEKIDLFVSTTSFAELGEHHLCENNWKMSCQNDMMSQMYVAKYILPQMAERGSGYLLNMVPAEKLMSEFSSGNYSTLKHPSLDLAERLKRRYESFGVKISVLCSDSFVTIKNSRSAAFKLTNLDILANLAVWGIQEERFMINGDDNSFARTKRKPEDDCLYNIIRA